MMNLDGLEMIAVLVVMGLFIKVLEQFGLFEPVGGEDALSFLQAFSIAYTDESFLSAHAMMDTSRKMLIVVGRASRRLSERQ
ncbi:hypothetical protein SRHO_G00255480 [Serrasalmus rhombeus]